MAQAAIDGNAGEPALDVGATCGSPASTWGSGAADSPTNSQNSVPSHLHAVPHVRWSSSAEVAVPGGLETPGRPGRCNPGGAAPIPNPKFETLPP